MANEQSTPENNLIGRRQALCTLAGITTAVAGFALIGVGTARAAETPDANGGDAHHTVTAQQVNEQVEVDSRSARELAMVETLIPAGLDLGKWTVEKVQAPMLGAIPVVMRSPAGDAFQVDVLRRDDAINGVADTKYFSLFVVNGGNGSTSTDEMQARGAKVLAHHLRHTELSGVRPELMSFAQRSRRHPFGNFGVLG